MSLTRGSTSYDPDLAAALDDLGGEVAELRNLTKRQQEVIDLLCTLAHVPGARIKTHFRCRSSDGVVRAIAAADVGVNLAAGRRVERRTEHATDWEPVLVAEMPRQKIQQHG